MIELVGLFGPYHIIGVGDQDGNREFLVGFCLHIPVPHGAKSPHPRPREGSRERSLPISVPGQGSFPRWGPIPATGSQINHQKNENTRRKKCIRLLPTILNIIVQSITDHKSILQNTTPYRESQISQIANQYDLAPARCLPTPADQAERERDRLHGSRLCANMQGGVTCRTMEQVRAANFALSDCWSGGA